MEQAPLGDDGDDARELVLTPTDQQMVRTLVTIQSARTGVTVLRVIAGIVAVAGIVGQALSVFEFERNYATDSEVFLDPRVPDREQWGMFLTGVAFPLACAGLLLALSYLLSVYAARLDMDIVLAEMDEPDESAPGD